jgi:hypothetical protein
MSYFHIYVTLIIIIKIIFIILALSHVYLRIRGADKDLDEKILHWKERIEFVFKTMMSILLIYIFHPRLNNMKLLDYETRILFYLFGFILLFTANWDVFIKEAPWFSTLQGVIGDK